MSEFIADRVENEVKTKGLEAGQEKYRAYFVRTKMYLEFKPKCDYILIADGYKDAIVEE